MPRPVAHGAIATGVQDAAKQSVTVASLNIAAQPRIRDVLAAWMQERSIDVLLLQEVREVPADGQGFAAGLSDRLGLHYAYAPADLLADGSTQGLAIVSRYPLDDLRVQPLEYFRLRFRSRCRVALVATVNAPAGPVRLVNIHLDTRINTRDRVAQLAPVLHALEGFGGPWIIAGDFNTMNIRWFRTMWPFPYLQRQSAAVRALLGSAGFQTPLRGTPATFRFLGIPLRLDWLFVKGLEPVEWGVDRLRLTDHRGVWARVKP